MHKHTVGGGVVSAQEDGCVVGALLVEGEVGCNTLRWLLGTKPA